MERRLGFLILRRDTSKVQGFEYVLNARGDYSEENDSSFSISVLKNMSLLLLALLLVVLVLLLLVVVVGGGSNSFL